MKKILFIIFFIFIIIYTSKSNFKVMSTFSEYGVNKYILDTSKCNITTNNLNNKLDGYNIVALYPHIDTYYKSILKDDLRYFYLNDTNDIDLFTQYYKNLLKKIGRNYLINYTNYKGIKIDEVIIYTSSFDLNSLISRQKCINIK